METNHMTTDHILILDRKPLMKTAWDFKTGQTNFMRSDTEIVWTYDY